MLPILAELQRDQGCTLTTLLHRTGAPRQVIDETLRTLIRLGLVMRNPGLGNLLHPEYLLTPRAVRAGPTLLALYDFLTRHALRDTALKRWSLPVLLRTGLEPGGVRFSALREALPPITDRALALALKDLQSAGLITRLVLDSYPPTTLYQSTPAAGPVVDALRALLEEFPFPPAGAEEGCKALG
jgi:DNA-binding HxlR family transcriptional regulator